MKEGEQGADVGRSSTDAASSVTSEPEVNGHKQDVEHIAEDAGGARRPWLLWVLAGAVIVGVVILALLVFRFLSPADVDPTPSATVRYLTSTPLPTRTA